MVGILEAPADRETQKAIVEAHNQRLEQYVREVDLEAMGPEELLGWAAETFPERAVINTSFQYTGMAQIHMAAAAGLQLRVATLDTLRLHPETYDFIGQVEERYGMRVEVHKPDLKEVHSMVERFGEFLFFDTKERQEYCCHVRKTRNNERLLKTVDCWISGLRRDQSASRQETARKADLVPESEGSRRKILKLNPLADWSGEQLLDFVEREQVLTHPLYARGYASFGCEICATPIRPGEDARAGRWRWFNNSEAGKDDKKECGLHVPLYNI